jgi:hypothetical protein
MKTLLITITIFLINHSTWSKEINCTNFDNNKVRCLAKKRCRWIDAPGANVEKGLCSYKDIAENQEEIQKYKQVLLDKEACMKALVQYDNDREMKVRAEVINDATSVQYQQERMDKQLKIIGSIDGCAEVGGELNVKVEKIADDKKNIKTEIKPEKVEKPIEETFEETDENVEEEAEE